MCRSFAKPQTGHSGKRVSPSPTTLSLLHFPNASLAWIKVLGCPCNFIRQRHTIRTNLGEASADSWWVRSPLDLGFLPPWRHWKACGRSSSLMPARQGTGNTNGMVLTCDDPTPIISAKFYKLPRLALQDCSHDEKCFWNKLQGKHACVLMTDLKVMNSNVV